MRHNGFEELVGQLCAAFGGHFDFDYWNCCYQQVVNRRLVVSSLTYVLNVLGQGKLFSISGSEEICALCVDRLRDLYAGLRIDSRQRSCLAEKIGSLITL